jgi:hypothetical protein
VTRLAALLGTEVTKTAALENQPVFVRAGISDSANFLSAKRRRSRTTKVSYESARYVCDIGDTEATESIASAILRQQAFTTE